MLLQKLTEKQFKDIAKLVYDKTGIHLEDRKLGLLSNRLRRRLKALNMTDFAEYYRFINSDKGFKEEESHFLSAVTTNETYFFRNDQLWKFITDELIDHYIQTKKSGRKSIRVWSAASSSGEEAYTCAIVMRELLPNFSTWDVKIVGSDISNNVLDKAKAAVYNDYAVSKTSPERIKKWFVQKDGAYHLKDEIQKMVEFKFHNLRDSMAKGTYDLIFLRNVLMYFDVAMKKRVIDVVTEALAPNGRLIVGDVDPIRTISELSSHMTLEYLRPGVYGKPSITGVDASGRKQMVTT